MILMKNQLQINGNPDIVIFDRDLIKIKRQRAAENFANHDFLYQWGKNQISERIYDINRRFTNAMQIGSRGILAPSHDKIDHIITLDLTNNPIESCKYFVQASEEFLPIAPKSMDLIISNLNMHNVNDLLGALIQIKHSLKDDGLFIASIFGGETLYELRKIMMKIEVEFYGGVSPRISPFADKPQMGDLLGRAGFTLPVIDSDIITVTYDNIFKLLHDIRGMGESNAIIKRNKTNLDKTFFMRVAEEYKNQFTDKDGRITASFEIIFMLGWSPHKSQQKPLRPGSAKTSLADALGEQEIKL